MSYRSYSLEKLFCCFADENGRICKEDAEITQRNIEAELKDRVIRDLMALREAQAYEDGEVIFDRFLNGKL